MDFQEKKTWKKQQCARINLGVNELTASEIDKTRQVMRLGNLSSYRGADDAGALSLGTSGDAEVVCGDLSIVGTEFETGCGPIVGGPDRWGSLKQE